MEMITVISTVDSIDGDTVDERMTPRTCKAARILIEMSQIDLAARAGVSVQTLRNYENEESVPSHKTWMAIKRALEQVGIRFIDQDESEGPGLRLRKPQ